MTTNTTEEDEKSKGDTVNEQPEEQSVAASKNEPPNEQLSPELQNEEDSSQNAGDVTVEEEDPDELPEFLSLGGYSFNRRFSELPIRQEITAALLEKGYRSATRIQQAIIEHCSAGEDWWLSVNLSSNRSIAFGAYCCERAMMRPDKTSVLLVSTVPEVRRNLGSDIEEISMFSTLKILSLRERLESTASLHLSDKPNIVIASPEDVILLAQQGAIDLAEIECCVLDEAEKFLRGKETDLFSFLSEIPNAQLIVQSSYYKKELQAELAVYRPELRSVRFSKKDDPHHCSVWQIDVEEQIESIIRLVARNTKVNFLIVADEIEQVEEITAGLSHWGIRTEMLCAGSHSKQKERVLRWLSENQVQVLVATTDLLSELKTASVSQLIVYSTLSDSAWQELSESFQSIVSDIFSFTPVPSAVESSSFVLPSVETLEEKRMQDIEKILLQDGLRSGFASYLDVVEQFASNKWGRELLAIALAETVQKHRIESLVIQEEMKRREKKDIFFSNRRKHHRGRKYPRKKRG